MSRRGRLIALEGIDGCGKSTQARQLAAALGALLTYEPGATDLGGQLRRLLLDSPVEVSARTEALLMAGDRAQHVHEVIEPALSSGQWVVTDRYSPSTLAYQGYGRGLPLDDLQALVSWAAGGVEPDLTVLLDVEPALAMSRRQGDADRLEGLDSAFHDRVRRGYLDMAARAPEVWVVVDGAGETTSVSASVIEAVEARLGRPAGSG